MFSKLVEGEILVFARLINGNFDEAGQSGPLSEQATTVYGPKSRGDRGRSRTTRRPPLHRVFCYTQAAAEARMLVVVDTCCFAKRHCHVASVLGGRGTGTIGASDAKGATRWIAAATAKAIFCPRPCARGGGRLETKLQPLSQFLRDLLCFQMRIALEHAQGFMPGDARHLHDVQFFFEES